MQFVFWLGNHNELGQRSLEDVIGIIGQQMRALGHRAVWKKENDQLVIGGDGINVIVEGFTEGTVRLMAAAKAQGARFLILATEEPTPKGFNWGTQREMVERQKVFPEAAKLCEGIIYLVPGESVGRWYGDHAPAAYTELGYAPALVRQNDFKEPDFDFGFYGTLSSRREKLLKKFQRQTGKRIKIMPDFGTQTERDVEMRRARVILQIRKFEEMGLVSSSRCNTALCIGRPVVAEPHDLSKPWDEIVQFSLTWGAFVNDAMMTWSAWRGVHAQQMAKFKAALPPEACIGKALDEIGILQRRAA